MSATAAPPDDVHAHAAPVSLAPGDVVGGRYRVERLLGQGARKVVHLAHDLQLERPVAVCALRPDRRSPDEVARLRREAAVLARVGDHPTVVAVYDVVDDGGAPLVLCQYLSGGSVQERLRSGGLSVREALAVAADVAAALAHAHAAGVVHRDVKPANVWLTATGRAVLGDFGLAARNGDEPDGLLVGSASYMSPEQALGGATSPASDLYSLGALLFALLCGRPPFVAERVLDAVDALLHTEPAAPSACAPGVPPPVDDLVLRLLAKDPARRPASAREVLAELRALLRSAGPTVQGSAPGALVGRREELGQLRSLLAEAEAGRGGLVLLVGEAGMGKTRTGLELAREAAGQGWLVLAARCSEGVGTPSFWPWTQVLRAAARELGVDRLRQAAGHTAPLLATVLPELGPAPDLSAAPLDADSSRFQLFDAVATVLRAMALERRLLVAVDDVHWADPASLALTAFLGRQVADVPVALLVCCRDDEADVLGALTPAAARTVVLHGLPVEDAGELLERVVGVRPADPVLARLHAHTDGNPFFLGELARLLAAEHRLDAPLGDEGLPVPAGVREVLVRRLAHLSSRCVALLRTASVLGRQLSVDVLRAVVDEPAETLLPLLEEAVGARLVTRERGVLPRYRFAHALVQEVLYDELPALARVRLHRRAGDVLSAAQGDSDEHVAAIASHYVRAAAEGGLGPAVAWSARAARAASAAGASEDAVGHWVNAVRLRQQAGDDEDVPDLVELLLALGEAQCRDGDTAAGRATFARAADLALLRGDPVQLARAALGYGVGLGGFGFVEHADGVLLSLLEEALAGLPTDDSPLRVRVLARLATELYFTPFRSRRLQLSEEAVDMAVRLQDRACELVAVYSRALALLGPRSVDERRRTAERVLRLAGTAGDTAMAFRGHQLRLTVALETGTLDQALSDVDACRRIAATDPQPVHQWQAAVQSAMLTILEGRFDEARDRMAAALELGRRGHDDMALVMYGAQLLTVSWAQGRLGDVVDAARSFADRYPHAPAWRAALAFCYLELGRVEEAQTELDVLAQRDFEDLPYDGNWLTAAGVLALVAAGLEDRPRCTQLRGLLEPYADRSVVVAAGAVLLFSVHLPLGVLAAALGDGDAALRHLDAAQESHRARGARPHVVWTAEEQVRVLLRRGDLGRAREVLDEALPLARELGMPGVVSRLSDVERALHRRASTDDRLTVMLTDVAGSTALTERLGEEPVHLLLLACRRHVAAAAGRHGGTVLKSLGDGLLVAFDDAAEAVRCAAELQRDPVPGEHELQLRIALHTGPVLREGESMYGRTMILAFRLADRARAGEVLVSSATRDAVAGEPDLAFDAGRRVRLKGLTEPQRVHRLRAEQA